MATEWPITLPDPFIDFKESWDMPSVTSQTEMGVSRNRILFTSANRLYTVRWPYLTADEKEDITDFFNFIGWNAGYIEWTHPGDASTLYVRLHGPVQFQSIGSNKWTTTLQFLRVDNAAAI